jgi:hypothetical protein
VRSAEKKGNEDGAEVEFLEASIKVMHALDESRAEGA